VGILPLGVASLERAKVPAFTNPPLTGVSFDANPKPFQQNPLIGPGAVYIDATRSSEAKALAVVHPAALDYVRWLTARQDGWLQAALRRPGDPALQKARRTILTEPARYELKYVTPTAGAGSASPALRGALLGLVVAALAAALYLARRRPAIAGDPAAGDGAAAAPAPPSPAVVIGAGAVSAALVAASSAAASTAAYTFCFIALLFAAALLYALFGGTKAIRTLLVCVIVIAPLRGALLALADSIDLPNAYLSFNAIQPSLIAACAAAVLLTRRTRALREEPPLLLAAWAAIAVVCVADFATQTVGLKLYAIGLAQYLVYPTFALLAWPLIGPRDREWLVWAFCALGVLVAVSEFLEVGGVYFAEAVQSGNRFGGATGSYLHSAIFLGTTAVLALGALFARWSRRNAALAVAAIGVMLAGIALTYSRGGLAIAVIGAAVLLVVLRHRRERLRLVAVVACAAAVGLGLSTVIGPNSGALASATGSGASYQRDPGNAKRIAAMKKAINEYRALPAKEKAFGKGLAATGNAGKLTSQEPDPTESYPLKILVETGAFGAILIGAVLLWAVACFARTSWAEEDRLLKGVGAAGLGLSAEAVIYPTLEVQLIAMTWWLLVAICLGASTGKVRRLAQFEVGEEEGANHGGTTGEPALTGPVSGRGRS
jgi:hypothetical protein